MTCEWRSERTSNRPADAGHATTSKTSSCPSSWILTKVGPGDGEVGFSPLLLGEALLLDALDGDDDEEPLCCLRVSCVRVQVQGSGRRKKRTHFCWSNLETINSQHDDISTQPATHRGSPTFHSATESVDRPSCAGTSHSSVRTAAVAAAVQLQESIFWALGTGHRRNRLRLQILLLLIRSCLYLYTVNRR